MAISAMDGGSVDVKRPLTPPADFMDVDISVREGALANGHNIKESSPNSAPPTGNSTQATSIDDSESVQVNGVDKAAIKANDVAKQLNAEHSTLIEAEPVAPPAPPQDHIVDLQEEGADNAATLDSTSSILQPQISDLREAPHSATSGHITQVEAQKHQEDISQGTNLINGSSTNDHQVAEASVTTEPQASVQSPVHSPSRPSTVEPVSQPLTSDQNQKLEAAASELAITTTEIPHHPPVPVPDAEMPEAPLDPAPSPRLSNETSTLPPEPEPMSIDKQTSAAPQSPSKLSRPREDDGDEAPAAKRSKVEDESSLSATGSTSAEFKVPAQPGHAATNDVSTNMQHPPDPMTGARRKHILKAIQNTKRSSDAKPFLTPVDVVLLNIPNYPNIVKNPMDLRTMEEKLKDDRYAFVQAVRADLSQIVENTTLFNGPDHPVTRSGHAMAKVFERGMVNLPGPEVEDAAPANKKSRKTSLPAAPKVMAPRRESRTSLPVSTAPSPVTEQSPTFALGPQGIPLIRRDSTKLGDRPKREIHPPAPRDLPYANSKPKKKKYQAELKFCGHVLDELAKQKYASLVYPFAAPVDPVALNIPDYHSIIKKPMDLRTVREKLENAQYENAKEFEQDVKLIFANCRKYNGPEHPIRASANEVELLFNREMSNKRSWIDTNTPASGPQSPTSSDEEDDDEDEEDEEEAEEAADNDQLSKLERSIAEMSEQVRRLQQKKKSPQVSGKKVNKGGAKAEKKGGKKGASALPAKQERKAPSKSSRKEQYVTYEQKQEISNRINSLSEAKMAKALKIIRDNMPNLKGIQDDELELDIDELSDNVLRKLSDFVKKNSKAPDDVPRPPPVVSAAPPVSRKKNKPMSKQEQDRRIESLKERQAQFENPTPSIENVPDACKCPALDLASRSAADGLEDGDQHDTSGDEEASEESEEE
ncbi:MAG: hypothetical protein L6R36_007385 [Xanthoria steineri]|nr:MAG: hypothetical protein L6R36_007385 [Xanthoria steineri]